MKTTLLVLEPVAENDKRVINKLSPRLDSLHDKTVLLVDNRKTSAHELLRKVGAILQADYGVKSILSVQKQPDYSRAVTLVELGENIGKAHLAVTALGD
mgnify:CR=1 FL=1